MLPDVQSTVDPRNIAIARVGIKSLRYPVSVATSGGALTTVATADMFVALPGDRKGTHMSRFIEVLRHGAGEPLSAASVPRLLAHMLRSLEADEGSIELRFSYFINKSAPVSGVHSLMDYEVALGGSVRGGVTRVRQKVVVPVTSLCPCTRKLPITVRTTSAPTSRSTWNLANR